MTTSIKIMILTLVLGLVASCCLSQSYTYDDLNRLVEVDYGNGTTINYTFDLLGNRTQYITDGSCSAPYLIDDQLQMDFEGGIGSWVQLNNDDNNWTLYEGGTQTGSTGPNAASSNKQYLYTEASGGNYNLDYVLQSACYDISNLAAPEFSFDYHMYGSNTGSLRVDISTNGGSSFTNLMPQINGNQGNAWQTFSTSLSSYSTGNVVLKITATTGSSFRSDIAIDNIKIIQQDCVTDLVLTNVTNPLYQSSNSIITSGTVNVVNGQATEFRSNEITLENGFNAQLGSEVYIAIDPCSN